MSKGRGKLGRKNKWYQFKGLSLGAHLAYSGNVVTRSLRGEGGSHCDRVRSDRVRWKWCCWELERSPCCIGSYKQPCILAFILNCQFFNIAFEKQDVMIGYALELILGALQTGGRMRVQIGETSWY